MVGPVCPGTDPVVVFPVLKCLVGMDTCRCCQDATLALQPAQREQGPLRQEALAGSV